MDTEPSLSLTQRLRWELPFPRCHPEWCPFPKSCTSKPPGVPTMSSLWSLSTSSGTAIEWQWIPYHMCSSLTRNHSPTWGSTFSCPYLTLRILPLSHITLFLNTQPNLPEAFTKYRRSLWLTPVFVCYYPAKIPQSKIMLRVWQLAWNVGEGKPRDWTQWLSPWSHPPVHT